MDLEDWQLVPCVSGRVATEEDVHEGRASFYSPNTGEYVGNRVFQMSLPRLAIWKDEETASEVPVVVIQAEQAPEYVVVGFRLLDGSYGVCSLNELELVDELDPRFRAA
jgi:hypothetical protein